MKKRTYLVAQVNYFANDSIQQAMIGGNPDEAEAVLAQAEAHQDLRFHATSNSVENIVILPWESVISVSATYETADVAAPTDTICGGEAESPLVLTLVSPSENCYEATDGVITAFVSTYDGDTRIHQYPNESLSWSYIAQIMFDGVDITEDESVEGTYELTLANGVATYTITVSYQGYTASQSLTATEVCSYIGG